MAISHILIDNDKLMHMTWSMAAKDQGIELDCFLSFEAFIGNESQFSRDSVFYIDSDLGLDDKGVTMRGEILSEQLLKLGFSKLFLATGYKGADFKKPDWIIKVLGKRPCFQLEV